MVKKLQNIFKLPQKTKILQKFQQNSDPNITCLQILANFKLILNYAPSELDVSRNSLVSL